MKKKDIPFVSEEKIQTALVEYLTLKRIVFTSVPNESKRSTGYGGKLKRMGLQKGFPDLLIFTRTLQVRGAGFVGIAIELKSSRGKVRPEQKEWLDKLVIENWLTKVCWSLDEVIDFLESWGY